MTVRRDLVIGGSTFPVEEGEFWTARQRQASSIHEVSYRACFKPQLPEYFITQHTRPGDVVYDPFGGRGTTLIEAARLGRRVIQNDINPVSRVFAEGRLYPPDAADLAQRLDLIPRSGAPAAGMDLSMFYQADTLAEILALRQYFIRREATGAYDALDRWIRMVATNRLTGHSPGFFSVYTFPPNQAVSAESQIRINEKRGQQPEYRDTRRIILKKSRQLVSGLSDAEAASLRRAAETARFLTGDASRTPEIADGSVDLVVTSPPFLDMVQYRDDNWLRCWFNGIDAEAVGRNISTLRRVEDWAAFMGQVLRELARVVKPGGRIAFEVGEVRKGAVRLDEVIAPLGESAGLGCEKILINTQSFTKTSNIWGISNNEKGTNSNRIVVFLRP